jgi:RNA polymerase sigma factor (sigma-70 family)
METVVEGARGNLGREGFAEFFRDHYETLLRAMFLVTGDRYEAEELAQDAFVKVCERWDRVRGMENRSGYLYRTAMNARGSAIRRLSLASRRTFALTASDPISESDDRDRIRRALAVLPASQREAVVLVEWLGLSDEEAGRTLGTSAGAIRVRLSRARTSLRALTEGTSG